MTGTVYHKLLRITALTLAFVLLFVSGVFTPITKELSRNAGSYVAAGIGMNASVLPTETNTLTAQLQERERALKQREIDVSLRESGGNTDMATYILSMLLFILLVLIILNYVLDFVRARQQFLKNAS